MLLPFFNFHTMNEFSTTSKERRDTCHPDLIKILDLAITLSAIDFGVSEGHRPTARQQKLYAQGRTEPGKIVTRVDGITQKSRHQTNPSEAVDLYAYYNGRAQWKQIDLAYIAGVMQAAARILFAKGTISHLVTWGGNWDNDGIILIDQSFDDAPHFQLYKP